MLNNIEATHITASYNELIDFVLHFFQDPSEYSIIDYELITSNELKNLLFNLGKYGITSNDDVDDKFIKLIGLFNIIRAIYNMNVAFNIHEFVDKMKNYKKDDKNLYNQLLFNIDNVWWLDNRSITRANSSTDDQQSRNSVSSKASSLSIHPSSYAKSSNDSSSIASSLLSNRTMSSSYMPISRLSTNSSLQPI